MSFFTRPFTSTSPPACSSRRTALVQEWIRNRRRIQTAAGVFLAALICTLAPRATAGTTIHIGISCGAHGSISPISDVTLPSDSNLTITATPDAGYRILDWFLNGQGAGWDVTQHTFAFGDLDVNVHVEFERLTNMVHTFAGANGTLTPSDPSTPTPVGWDDDITFTALPDPHYHVDLWTLDGPIIQHGGTSLTIAKVKEEHWLEVSFAPDLYTIDASSVGLGNLSPTGRVSVAYGASQQFTATPAAGHDVLIWSIDGQPALTNATVLTLDNVVTNHTVQASFSRPQLSISLTQTNTVIVNWTAAMSDYTLQSNPDLNTNNWVNINSTPLQVNGQCQLVRSRSPGTQFFRLTQ